MYLCGLRYSLWQSAEGCHVTRTEFPPIGEDSGECDSDFTGSELEKTMARSAREGILQTLRKLGRKRRCVAILDQGEMAVWG